jgi:hypothetical protein
MEPHEVCRRPDLAGDSVPMLAKLNAFSLLGIEAVPVEVEVDVSPSGLARPALGLPPRALPPVGPLGIPWCSERMT